MPAVSTPTTASPPTAQSQSPPFIGRSHSLVPHDPGLPVRRSRSSSRAARRSRGPNRMMLAARNHTTTVSPPVAKTSAGTATCVVRKSSRAPATNSAAEPTRPSGGTRSGPGPSCSSKPVVLNGPSTSHTPNDPSSATRRTGRLDCNRDAAAGFAAAHVRPRS
jgi:hypothetical protein